MEKTFYSGILKVMCVGILLFTAYSCSDDDNPTTPAGPDAKSVNGRITFVDTNFILSGGTYLISAYPASGWPPMGGPAAYDTVLITRTNNVLDLNYNYKLSDLNPGDYVISVGFRRSTGGQSPIMSVYGCDTARAVNGSTCFLNPPNKATIGPNNEGVEGINMISWSDTAKKVY